MRIVGRGRNSDHDPLTLYVRVKDKLRSIVIKKVLRTYLKVKSFESKNREYTVS